MWSSSIFYGGGECKKRIWEGWDIERFRQRTSTRNIKWNLNKLITNRRHKGQNLQNDVVWFQFHKQLVNVWSSFGRKKSKNAQACDGVPWNWIRIARKFQTCSKCVRTCFSNLTMFGTWTGPCSPIMQKLIPIVNWISKYIEDFEALPNYINPIIINILWI